MKATKHFKTITKHRFLVMKYCFRSGLYWQGLVHDLSKYSPAEFLVGARYFQGDRSPNDIERREKGYSAAWLHHKGRNKHHLEYWIDYGPRPEGGFGMTGMKMPEKYVVEMFCDRYAAARVYQGKNFDFGRPYEYFMDGKAHTMIHPESGELLETLLRMLKDEGEDAVFGYIRRDVLGN